MRTVVIGAGSIGSRHLKNASLLSEAGVYDINVNSAEILAKSIGAIHFTSMEALCEWKPHAAIIATPHQSHVPVAEQLIRFGVDVLVEKPVSDRLSSAKRLQKLAKDLNRKVYVVCNMRFHPGVELIKRYMNVIGDPLFARAHYGNWLPAMRPGSDYRELYCANASQGGGVVLDAIHELDYLSCFFGEISTCVGLSKKLSELEIDVEDYAGILIEHESGVCSEIHVDYIQPCKRRGCEVIGTKGILIWESVGKNPEKCKVKIFRSDQNQWKSLLDETELDGADMYYKLMETFIENIGQKETPKLLDISGAINQLDAALTIKNSTNQAIRT